MKLFSICNRYIIATTILLIIASEARAFNDPVTGRWITRDPIGYADGMNLYEYMISAPVDFSDPLGFNCNDSESESKEEPADSPLFDRDNPCNMACSVGMTECRTSGGTQEECETCHSLCLSHCEKKKSDGFTPTKEHGSEFWEYDSDCGKSGEAPWKLPAGASPNKRKVIHERAKSRVIIRNWERYYGKTWPTHKGKPQIPHHKKALVDGGTNHPRNVVPMTPKEHVELHKRKGDYKRWGKMRGSAKPGVGYRGSSLFMIIDHSDIWCEKCYDRFNGRIPHAGVISAGGCKCGA